MICIKSKPLQQDAKTRVNEERARPCRQTSCESGLLSSTPSAKYMNHVNGRRDNGNAEESINHN